MTRDRDRYRPLTAAAVLLVASIAAVVSYLHVATLALRYGQQPIAAYLLPVSVDGLVATSSLAMLRSARAGVSAPWLARSGLVLGVAATLAANVAAGLPHGWPGAVLSGWPAVAFVVSAETAIAMSRAHIMVVGLALLPERIRSRIKVNPETGCWEWQGTPSPDGYGRVSWQGRDWMVHRAVFTILNGPIPDQMTLDHVKERGCASTMCCWPGHLEPVIPAENSRRMHAHRGHSVGKRPARSPADTEAAALAALATTPDMTHKQLATAIGVSERTARRVRGRLATPVNGGRPNGS